IITAIELAQFYNNAELGNPEPDEIAQIFANAILAEAQNQSGVGVAPLFGFDPSATFTQLSVPAGLWLITNPFSSTAISTLTFRAANTPSPADCVFPACDNSDYSIALVQTTNVPEPSTLSLIGLGLLSVGAMVRRRRKVVAP